MLANRMPAVLLASHDPALLACVEPVLTASSVKPHLVLSAEAAVSVLTGPTPPDLSLLDVELPGMEDGRLLSRVRSSACGHRLPIVLLADEPTPEWMNRLAEGTLDDLIPRSTTMPHWRLRLDAALRTFHRMRQLELLRESAALSAQTDVLTGVYNRATLLSMLFRETDRVQRMKTPLCLLLLDLDDFGHWNMRLGTEVCDDLLCLTAERMLRLLRTYDLLGRAGKDEFLVVLPGCDRISAVLLAERLRQDAFSAPFHAAGQSIRLSACFGIASSEGRSPVVVLREAEQALQQAKETGPESIQFCGSASQTLAGPVAFLSPSSGDELLAW